MATASNPCFGTRPASDTMSRRTVKLDRAERDARYEQLVELAPDGILLHDGDRIVGANAAAQALVGATSREQLVGQPVEAFLTPPFLKGVEEQLTGGRRADASAPAIRETLHRLDGADLDVEVRALPFVDHGRPAAHLVIRDISERLAIEQLARENATRLQDAQKMEAVGALAGGVAHEVNNMMQVVLGGGAVLLEDETLTQSQRKDLEQILSAAERAATVTQQLLAFSRHAAHQPVAVDLAAAVHGLVPTLRRLLGDQCELLVSFEKSPRVLVDPGQLQQMVVNLALNARDATPSGGSVTISAGPTAVPQDVRDVDGADIPPGAYGSLVVQDTGHGMDEALQARIFEPFFTTKPRGRGTGLGLAAVHGILAQSGGHLTLASAPGEGTTFTLYLPIAPATAPHAISVGRVASIPRSAPGTRAAMILVVDDEPALRAIATRILKRSGYQTISAADGATALALIESDGVPDLVLSDLQMPGMSGVVLLREIRRRWPSVRVLLMSGNATEALEGSEPVVDVGQLLEKPFTPTAMLTAVAAQLAMAAGPDAR